MGDNGHLGNSISLYEQAPCGLLSFKLDGSIIQANQTLLSWLGMTKEELGVATFPGLLDKGGQFYYQLFVLPSLRMQREVNEISFQIERANVNFFCLFSASVFDTGNNGAMLVSAVIYKVVDRKKYETELLLKKAKADAEKRISEERLRIVALAQSHLVRAPLANILGLTTLLQEVAITDELQHLSAMLQESAEKLDSEIRRIVDTASDKTEQQG